MGNSQVAMTQEQQEQVVVEASVILQGISLDPTKDITSEEWVRVFSFLDANNDSVVSRKEWCLQQGTTELFDAIHKKNNANCTEAEWAQAFKDLDVNGDGNISIKDWQSRRMVSLAMQPLGYGRYHWAVRIGSSLYEVPIPGKGQTNTEIAVLGPEGIIALGGDLATAEEKKQGWLELMLAYTQEGIRPQSSWLESKTEPTSLPEEAWTDFQIAGWTSKTDEELLTFLKTWAAEHPTYVGFHALGKETNNQTFCVDVISFVTGSPFAKWTDGSKGRALAITGAVLLGGIAAVAVYRNNNKGDGEAGTPSVADK